MIYVLFLLLLQVNSSFAQDEMPPISEPTPEAAAPAPTEDPAVAAPSTATEAPAAPPVAELPPPKMEEPMEEESLVITLTKPFVYDRAGKRDPFAAPVGKPPPLIPGEVFGPFLELQEIPLESIVLKGIFLDPVSPKVLIEYDVKGKKTFKRLTIRDYLGENFGVISSIRDGQVIVVQTLDQGDQKSTTTRTLTIRK